MPTATATATGPAALQHLWLKICGILESNKAAETKKAEVSADWEVAKETLSSRQETFDKALAEDREQHKDELPTEAWHRQQELWEDLSRAKASFELTDRNKRKLEKFVVSQREKLFDLLTDVYGDGRKFNFPAHEPQEGPSWKAASVADLVGDMFADRYHKLGWMTVEQAKAAFEGTAAKQALHDDKITSEDYDYLKFHLVTYLGNRGVEHKLGKAPKYSMPEPEEPAKKPKKGQAADGREAPADSGAFIDAGEVTEDQREQLSMYCGASDLANCLPVKRVVSIGDRRFVRVGQGNGFFIAAEATPRKEFEKAHPKNVLRDNPDEHAGPKQYAGVLTQHGKTEYVLGIAVRWRYAVQAAPSRSKKAKGTEA